MPAARRNDERDVRLPKSAKRYSAARLQLFAERVFETAAEGHAEIFLGGADAGRAEILRGRGLESGASAGPMMVWKV